MELKWTIRLVGGVKELAYVFISHSNYNPFRIIFSVFMRRSLSEKVYNSKVQSQAGMARLCRLAQIAITMLSPLTTSSSARN